MNMNFEELNFKVEVVELGNIDAKTWFATLEDVADDLEREDICLPFDELIREDWEFLEYVIVKTNKRCNNSNKNVVTIALKEFMGIQYP